MRSIGVSGRFACGFRTDLHFADESIAKLTSFLDGNCFLIASTVREYSLQQWLLRVLAYASTCSQQNAVYDHRSLRFEITFEGM